MTIFVMQCPTVDVGWLRNSFSITAKKSHDQASGQLSLPSHSSRIKHRHRAMRPWRTAKTLQLLASQTWRSPATTPAARPLMASFATEATTRTPGTAVTSDQKWGAIKGKEAGRIGSKSPPSQRERKRESRNVTNATDHQDLDARLPSSTRSASAARRPRTAPR